ncbi:B-box zinc finger protein 19 isoform X1 [Setaria viridis]|uniref:B-box zinc finger protein 19 isoform X1 n=1 Tax=Setaria viridis TaxID=4556 RepID=UPI001493D46B|nr:B-box zinc finger protein 19 isoform X1 [Setaria viridis]
MTRAAGAARRWDADDLRCVRERAGGALLRGRRGSALPALRREARDVEPLLGLPDDAFKKVMTPMVPSMPAQKGLGFHPQHPAGRPKRCKRTPPTRKRRPQTSPSRLSPPPRLLCLVHMCNKLASRHVRVGLANSNKLARCDICESFPAFFHCEIDGTSLCLSCDMTVHVGGKRTHGRYLLLRQSVEFPGDKLGHMDDVAMQSKDPETQIDQKPPHSVTKEQMANHHNGSDDPASDGNCEDQGNINSKMIDLNMRPVRTNGQGSNSQTQGVDHSVNNHDSPGVVPTSNYEGDANK